MKQLAIGLVLLFSPFIALADFQSDLHYGSKGDDVIQLQEFLTAEGVYTGPISGNFYSLTLSAVKRFQLRENITPVSGYVGPITRGVINATLETDAPVSEGEATTTISFAPIVTPTTTPTYPIAPVVPQQTQPIIGTITQPVITNVSTMKPPYSPLPFNVPVSITLEPSTPTVVVFNLTGAYKNWGDVFFQNTKILSKEGNEIVFTDSDGIEHPIHDRTYVSIRGMTPSTQYTYTFVYHEEGRDDTLVDKNFTTRPSI